MPVTVNIGGANKVMSDGWVNINGVWKKIDKIQTNIGGSWKTGYTGLPFKRILGIATSFSGVPRFLQTLDGITWSLISATSLTSAGVTSINSIAYGNGIFVVSTNLGIYTNTSLSAYGWTAATTQPTETHARGVAFGNGYFICATEYSSGCRIYRSSDGKVWTRVFSASSGCGANSFLYGSGNYWFGFSRTGLVGAVSSDNGASWTASTTSSFNAYNACYDGSRFFIPNGRSGVKYSSAGSTSFTSKTISSIAADDEWRGVLYGNGIYLATNSLADVWSATSYSGTWTKINDAVGFTPGTSSVFALDTFYVVGMGTTYTIRSSVDGVTWTTHSIPGILSNENIGSLVYYPY